VVVVTAAVVDAAAAVADLLPVTAAGAANSAVLPLNTGGLSPAALATEPDAVAAATADGSCSTAPVAGTSDDSVVMMAAEAAVAAAVPQIRWPCRMGRRPWHMAG